MTYSPSIVKNTDPGIPREREPFVLYSLGEPRTPSPGFYPMMPSHLIPAICQKHRCSLRILYTGDPITVEHIGHELVGQFEVTDAMLIDVDHDIWAEVKPWIEGLHREEGLT